MKGVIWVHNTKSGNMILKGVNCVHNDNIRSNGLERTWVHNAKIRSYGIERSQLGTQYQNQVIWS